MPCHDLPFLMFFRQSESSERSIGRETEVADGSEGGGVDERSPVSSSNESMVAGTASTSVKVESNGAWASRMAYNGFTRIG